MAALPPNRLKAAPPDHAVRGLVMGALAGSSLVGCAVGAMMIPADLSQAGRGDMIGGVLTSTVQVFMFFLFSFPVWAMGLIMIGAPGWAVLHALGWRSRGAGAAFGGVATFVTAWLLVRQFNIYPNHVAPLLILAGVLALMGAVVGWVVVSTAYERKTSVE